MTRFLPHIILKIQFKKNRECYKNGNLLYT